MGNKVSFIFVAQDRFTRVVREANRVVQGARQNFAGLRETVKTAGRQLDVLAAKSRKAGEKLRQVGKDVSLKVGLAAGATTAAFIANFDKQAVALAKVENSIRSTGGAAGLTMKQLTAEASRLQQETIFGDETILNDATAQLLTFTNIAGEQFLRAQQAALDLSTMLDGDLKSASIQLGKALNDPIANLSALSRSGIQFSADQKEVIKALAEAGLMADAQKIILTELEKQYGGTAKAAAEAGAGPIKQLVNVFGDLTEEIGGLMMDILRPFIYQVGRLTRWFGELSRPTKKFIAGAILLATVLGPVLIAFGAILAVLPLMATGLAMVAGAATLLLSPFLLIPAAIAAVVAGAVLLYQNFEPVREVVDGVADAIGEAIAQIQEFSGHVQDLTSGAFANVADFFGFGGDVDVSSRSRTDVNVNLRAPQGAVESVKRRTTGNTAGLNVGVNMAPAGS